MNLNKTLTFKLCLHTVLTAGFSNLLDSFIRSHNNKSFKLLIDFIGTKEEYLKNKDKFKSSNCDIHFRHVDLNLEIDKLGKRWPGADLSIKQSREVGKNICEEKSVNNKNLNASEKVNAIRWKQLISVEIRYRSLIKKALEDAKIMGFDKLIHLDCDMLLVGDLNKLIKFQLNSINLLIRDNKYDEINRKIFGCLIILKTNEYAFQFLDILKRIIDQQDFHSQKKGFGQTALFLAYKEFELISLKKYIGNIDLEFISSDWIKNKTIYYSGNYLDKSKIKLIMSTLISLKNLPFSPLLSNIFIFFIRMINRFSIKLKLFYKIRT